MQPSAGTRPSTAADNEMTSSPLSPSNANAVLSSSAHRDEDEDEEEEDEENPSLNSAAIGSDIIPTATAVKSSSYDYVSAPDYVQFARYDFGLR